MTERSMKRIVAAAAATVASLILSACDRHIATASLPEDYRQRHQIMLVRGNETLDVFVGRNARGLDRRQAEDVRGFGQNYMQNGEGPLVAYLPVSASPQEVNAGLSAIRSALAGGGAAGRLHIAQYHPEPGDAPAIKLAFARLQAKTPEACSYEDHDVFPTSWKRSNMNAPPRNFGCSYQRNLAAQVADPRDFVRPRQEGPIDVDRRTAGIERIRENEAQELKPAGKSLKQISTE
ncbi:MAG: CpaD family pilus assembly protein [Beijerinckiaceae bacterium]